MLRLALQTTLVITSLLLWNKKLISFYKQQHRLFSIHYHHHHHQLMKVHPHCSDSLGSPYLLPSTFLSSESWSIHQLSIHSPPLPLIIESIILQHQLQFHQFFSTPRFDIVCHLEWPISKTSFGFKIIRLTLKISLIIWPHNLAEAADFSQSGHNSHTDKEAVSFIL